MVVIFDNLGHSASRFKNGINTLECGDILIITDKIGKERVVYFDGINRGVPSLHFIDIGSEAIYHFDGIKSTLSEGWSLGYVVVSSITEWGILYELELPHRASARSMLAHPIHQLELMLEKIPEDYKKGQELDLITSGRAKNIFDSVQEESYERARNCQISNSEKEYIEQLQQLREQIPREILEERYEKIRHTQKGAWVRAGGFLLKNGQYFDYAKSDLEKGPYTPLDEFIKTIKEVSPRA